MLTILGTLAIVLVTIVLGVAADRRWGILPRKERLLAAAARPRFQLPAHAAGDAPATALPLAPAALAKLRRRRCPACRGRTTPLPDDHVTFDGRPLLLVRARCTRCGHAHATYVDAR